MSSYKIFLIKSTALSAFTLLIILITNLLIDPLKQYSINNLKPYYGISTRYLAAGLLKSMDYDSVLIGSSVTENFRKKEIDEKLHTNIIRLPFQGGSAFEHKEIIQLALQNKNLKSIIYGLDFFAFRGSVDRLENGPNSFPFYLYDNKLYNDYKYLLNLDTLYRENGRHLLANYLGIKKEFLDEKNACYWGDEFIFSKDRVIKSYSKKQKNINLTTKEDYNYKKFVDSFNNNLLIYIKRNPNITFIIFYPPYSILAYKDMERENWLIDSIRFKEYIFTSLQQYPNVKLFDFQTVQSVTNDLNNYKDSIHYSPKINSWIVDEIERNDCLVTNENYQYNSKSLLRNVKEFNLSRLKK